MSIKEVKIEKPWYSAGKQFKWNGSPVGFGIRLSYLKKYDDVDIIIGTSLNVWKSKTKRLLEFIEQHKSYYDAKGVQLGVVPWYLFQKKTIQNEQPKLWN